MVRARTRLLKDDDLRALSSGQGIRVTAQRMTKLRGKCESCATA